MDAKPVLSAALRAWANELSAGPAQLAPVRPKHLCYGHRAGLFDALVSRLWHRNALSKRELSHRQDFWPERAVLRLAAILSVSQDWISSSSHPTARSPKRTGLGNLPCDTRK
jgi:hypothetical protein